eukprot:Skav204026  [mRNA]  locus=scaffold229:272533:272765:+ [translate_table: standard]
MSGHVEKQVQLAFSVCVGDPLHFWWHVQRHCALQQLGEPLDFIGLGLIGNVLEEFICGKRNHVPAV